MKAVFIMLIILLLAITLQALDDIHPPLQDPKYPNTYLKDFEADAPWRVKSLDQAIPISAMVKDSDGDGVYIQWVKFYLYCNGGWEKIHEVNYGDNNFWLEEGFWEYIYEIAPSELSLSSETEAYFMVDLCVDEGWWYPEEHFKKQLKINIGEEKFPALPHWYQGDTHTHTSYTDNLYEFGASLDMLSRAASAMGLDWIFCTDHSCDFDAAGTGFNAQKSSLDYYNQLSSCLLLQGEEVTLDSDNSNQDVDDKIHMLSLGNDFIRGPENPVAQTTDTDSRLTRLTEALDQIDTGLSYAAHPFDPMESWLTGLTIGNLLEWNGDNISQALAYDKFCGLQLWNTRILHEYDISDMDMDPFPFTGGTDLTATYLSHLDYATASWQSLLTDHLNPLRKIFIAGGSDVHGDINYQTFLVPSLGNNLKCNDNGLAKVRTAVYCPAGIDTSGNNILNALANGNTITTDGPLLAFFLDLDGNGIVDGGDAVIGDDVECSISAIDSDRAQLLVQWINTPEFGGNLTSFILYYNNTALELNGKFAIGTSLQGSAQISLKDLEDEPGIDYSTDTYSFFRFEAYAENGHFRCYTNPIWLKVNPQPTIPTSPINIAITKAGEALNISWDDVEGADSYLIYAADHPAGAFVDISSTGIFTGSSWTRAITSGSKEFFYVTTVVDGKANLPFSKSLSPLIKIE